ncbi:MAG: dipeptidyl-peptidase 3 family protein [Thermoanaerobaculia bacterium]
MKQLFAVLLLSIIAIGCATQPATAPPAATAITIPITAAADAGARLQKMPRTMIDYDRTLLDDNETQVLEKLIEASKLIDEIFFLQVSELNPARREVLYGAASTEELRATANYFRIMYGPWDRIHENERFVTFAGDNGPKPVGAGFYPPDMTKEEFESWIAAHPNDRAAFEGLFTVIRRQGDGLVAIPYSQYYRQYLEPAAAKLREAAALTKNASLRRFLETRAAAFLSDDYYESDFAWMDLDSPIEVVIGPYEVYEDSLFNYKAAFESFVTVVDRGESEKLSVYGQHLAAMERNLPMPDEHKNPNRGSESPIKVVQEIFTAGDTRAGVQTSAFNLPNDERVREAKGSKKVLLKNVMEAKFHQSGNPIALRVLDQSQTSLISFNAYFNHVLFHELSHGLGPGIITGPDGKKIENRFLLKELYSTLEECKADVLGVWNVLYAIDQKLLTSFTQEHLFATDVGLMFRSMRFGLDEAHGRGTAIQWNWYRERGAIVPVEGGRFRVDMAKMRDAVKSLAEEVLIIEAVGDYGRGKKLIDNYGKSNAEIQGIIAKLTDVPVDIAPVFVAAGEK